MDLWPKKYHQNNSYKVKLFMVKGFKLLNWNLIMLNQLWYSRCENIHLIVLPKRFSYSTFAY